MHIESISCFTRFLRRRRRRSRNSRVLLSLLSCDAIAAHWPIDERLSSVDVVSHWLSSRIGERERRREKRARKEARDRESFNPQQERFTRANIAMEDEQDSPIQKKLSFSIDNILDKPQPLYLKIKHHHLVIEGASGKRKHGDTLALHPPMSALHSKQIRSIHTSDDNDAGSDCSAISTSDDDGGGGGGGLDDDDGGNDDDSCSEENDNHGMNPYSSHHHHHHHHHPMNHRKKKTRTVFSRTQIFQLETTFDRKRYLSSADRSNLAQGLRLTEQQVKVSVTLVDPSSSNDPCLFT